MCASTGLPPGKIAAVVLIRNFRLEKRQHTNLLSLRQMQLVRVTLWNILRDRMCSATSAIELGRWQFKYIFECSFSDHTASLRESRNPNEVNWPLGVTNFGAQRPCHCRTPQSVCLEPLGGTFKWLIGSDKVIRFGMALVQFIQPDVSLSRELVSCLVARQIDEPSFSTHPLASSACSPRRFTTVVAL